MIQQALIFDFSMGELDPRLRGRFDMEIYQHGAGRIENAVPYPQGGFELRKGTDRLGAPKGKCRLIPFIITADVAYVIELGIQYMRVWRNGQLLMNGQNPLELATTYTEAQLWDIQYTQDDSRLILTHESVAPAHLTYSGADTFTFGTLPITGNTGQVPFQGAGNYPRACKFHEGRLWLAGTNNKPGLIMASRPYKPFDFTTFDTMTSSSDRLKDPQKWQYPDKPEYEKITITRDIITAANAISIEIDDRILWLASGNDLVVGTMRSERVIPAGAKPPLVPCKKQTVIGSAKIQPHMIGSAILFIEADKKGAKEYIYQDAMNSYYAPALTFTAGHILQAGVREFDYQTQPLPILWFTLEDGSIAACVYAKGNGITAWHRWTTQGQVESVAVIPGNSGDDVYLSVLRGTERHMERMSQNYLDAAVSRTKTAGSVTGLPINGALRATWNGQSFNITATGGNAALPARIPDGQSVIIGIPYTMTVTTMPLTAGAQIGTAHMRPKNPIQIIARVLESSNFLTGNVPTQLDSAMIEGKRTGDIKIPIRGQWDTEGVVHFIQDTSQPCRILTVQAEVDAGG